jgi:hypothetical protein
MTELERVAGIRPNQKPDQVKNAVLEIFGVPYGICTRVIGVKAQ